MDNFYYTIDLIVDQIYDKFVEIECDPTVPRKYFLLSTSIQLDTGVYYLIIFINTVAII